MCDYSLERVASRPAKVGDKLTTTNFGTGTIGFAGIEDASVAVCLLPGTELAFDEPVTRLYAFGDIKPFDSVAHFTQKNIETPNVHHDALEFPNGTHVLLAQLAPGQTASVLQMPAKQEISHIDLSAEISGTVEVLEVVL